MTNTSENLVKYLSDLHAAFDAMAVNFSTGHTTDGAPAASYKRVKAETRKQIFDDAVEARSLVEKLETINDRMMTARRRFR